MEVQRYFVDNDSRLCAPTDYAISKGAWISDAFFVGDRAAGSWWLRSPGEEQYCADCVYGNGTLAGSDSVSTSVRIVRPAFWIDLDWFL